jgi:3-deoxy-manno-octulosonate cytidylyltransferase (CMP-KDO synthetase)
MDTPTVVGMIPARYESSRLPGKPLREILGQPMIQRVYERCLGASVLKSVCVATDDERIKSAVEAVDGLAIMTRPDHPSGTDRLAEAAQSLTADVVVNIQGDQPFIDPTMIDEAVEPLVRDASIPMATLMHRIHRKEDLDDPAVVKVVVDQTGSALYFSRSLIPYPRSDEAHPVYEHVGLYVYRRDFLLKLATLPPTPLEKAEQLEQLRVLEHGYRIHVVESQVHDDEFCGFSVDTPADLKRAEQLLRDRELE